MRVHVLTSFPPGSPDSPPHAVNWLRAGAALDPFRQHQLVDEPEAADVILFAEAHPGNDPFLLTVKDHPVYRRFPRKSFLYHDADHALPFLRGIYPSIRRRDYQSERCRSAGYIARLATNECVRYDRAPVERKWLYSFFGDANSAVRRLILAGTHPRGIVRDTTGRRHWEMPPGPERLAYLGDFAAAIQQSEFVLCPEGLGPCSYRLFETMEMGRVPVILSDDWVPVEGPRWEEFSVRVPESWVGDLEAMLAERSPQHEEMGRRARRAWEQYFSQEVSFHRLTEMCVALLAERSTPLSKARPWIRLATNPHFARIWLRPKYQRLCGRR